jgi:hypothetical protein
MDFDDSYVVRIYRRDTRQGQDDQDQVSLTGVVEHAASGSRTTFHDINELWHVLANAASGNESPARIRDAPIKNI